ncbi:MAG: hypothetical protein M3Z33_10910 [Actinomycetota bacterium]|nr:hypothetical protein [Actinomycetota bacterium]
MTPVIAYGAAEPPVSRRLARRGGRAHAPGQALEQPAAAGEPHRVVTA